jgi:hypothetical protein
LHLPGYVQRLSGAPTHKATSALFASEVQHNINADRIYSPFADAEVSESTPMQYSDAGCSGRLRFTEQASTRLPQKTVVAGNINDMSMAGALIGAGAPLRTGCIADKGYSSIHRLSPR